ncbi:MAG: hypothetical protein LAN64_03750 [Acidobacteriia bacterium]|nr:hypothetical protein [Terriglobia bacterium]
MFTDLKRKKPYQPPKLKRLSHEEGKKQGRSWMNAAGKLLRRWNAFTT